MNKNSKTKKSLVYKLSVYALHAIITSVILGVHYILTPFSILYDKTDWGLLSYRNFWKEN